MGGKGSGVKNKVTIQKQDAPTGVMENIPGSTAVASPDLGLYQTADEQSKVKANLETLAASAGSAADVMKSGRKRRVKGEVPPKTEEELKKEAELKEQAEDFALIGTQLLVFAVSALPNPIPPSDGEKTMFNRALNRCMLKWLPQMDKWGAEIALVASCAVISLPRLAKPKRVDVAAAA